MVECFFHATKVVKHLEYMEDRRILGEKKEEKRKEIFVVVIVFSLILKCMNQVTEIKQPPQGKTKFPSLCLTTDFC